MATGEKSVGTMIVLIMCKLFIIRVTRRVPGDCIDILTASENLFGPVYRTHSSLMLIHPPTFTTLIVMLL